MKRLELVFYVSLTFIHFAAAADFRSTKGGFQASFPGEVEEVVVDPYSSAWTSVDFIEDLFVMHQVTVLKEKPGGPLHYDTHEEYQAFFNTFLKELMQGYSNARVISSEYILWKNQYPAIKYTFSGVMVGYDISVINEGLALIYNRKIVKSSLIFPTILENDARLNRMVTGFHQSLIVF